MTEIEHGAWPWYLLEKDEDIHDTSGSKSTQIASNKAMCRLIILEHVKIHDKNGEGRLIVPLCARIFRYRAVSHTEYSTQVMDSCLLSVKEPLKNITTTSSLSDLTSRQ
jgi:hypothetical protein